MTYKKFIIGSAAAFALSACGGAGTEAGDVASSATPAETKVDTRDILQGVAAAKYSLEKSHAFMTVKIGHNSGISQYRISFTEFNGKMTFDPENPEKSTILFTINPASVETNYPGNYKESHEGSEWNSWNEDVSRDKKWLNADEYPSIKFTSTSAQRTGDTTGTVTGDLTLLGVTKPVTLDVSYNGSANPPWFGERDLIGFDATTTVKRSDFGMAAFIPNIGDDVTVEFSGEFLQDE